MLPAAPVGPAGPSSQSTATSWTQVTSGSPHSASAPRTGDATVDTPPTDTSSLGPIRFSQHPDADLTTEHYPSGTGPGLPPLPNFADLQAHLASLAHECATRWTEQDTRHQDYLTRMKLYETAAAARDEFSARLASSIKSLHVFATTISQTATDAKAISHAVQSTTATLLAHRETDIAALHASSTIPAALESTTNTLYNSLHTMVEEVTSSMESTLHQRPTTPPPGPVLAPLPDTGSTSASPTPPTGAPNSRWAQADHARWSSATSRHDSTAAYAAAHSLPTSTPGDTLREVHCFRPAWRPPNLDTRSMGADNSLSPHTRATPSPRQ